VSYVERRTGDLLVAELGMDGGALERELRRRDPLLSLQGWPSATHGCILWRVVRESGPDRPPETVAVWQSESGEPYPLSSGLLDLVDRLDRNSRHRHAGEDELERQRQVSRDRQVERENEALRDDWNPKHGRPLLPRSQSLRMARDKRRAKGEKC
jgi:hypothetical protein